MAGENAVWRPQIGGDIALSDEHLKRIGYAVVAEGHAKFLACTILKVIEQLPQDQWVRLDRRPLTEICRRLLDRSAGIDADLSARLEALEAARDSAHELRHIVVHATWGEEPGPERNPLAYDYGRQRLVTVADLDAAMNGCAELKRAAKWAAMRVAELIEDGVWPERPADTQGMGIRTRSRLVRL